MDIPLYIAGYNEDYHQNLNEEMLLKLSENGIVFPSKTSAQIVILEPVMPVGTVWFDTDLAKLVVKTATGTTETITSV